MRDQYRQKRLSNKEQKPLTLLLCAAVLMLFSAQASTAYAFSGPQDGGSRMAALADRLNLTDQQRQQFEAIHSDGRESGKSIHEAMRMNRDAMHKLDPGQADYAKQVATLADEKAELVKQMVIQRSDIRSQVHAILSPEQRKAASEMKSKFRKGGKRGQGGPDGKRRCDRD